MYIVEVIDDQDNTILERIDISNKEEAEKVAEAIENLTIYIVRIIHSTKSINN